MVWTPGTFVPAGDRGGGGGGGRGAAGARGGGGAWISLGTSR